MLKKIREINEALPAMLFVDLIYLLIGEIIILLFVPGKLSCGIGLLAGVIYSVFSSFHLSFKIRQVVYGGANGSKTYILGYMIRLAVMIAILAILYISKMGDLVCAIIGMFSMKVAAYMWPITNKLFLERGTERKI